jgi:hypothetical protein
MSLSKTHYILAFALHEKECLEMKDASLGHLKKLAYKYNLTYKETDFGDFYIGFVLRGEVGHEPITQLDQFVVCSHSQVSMTEDRYLLIQIENGQVKFSSDYAGSIPTFYSFRNRFSASNIEKCVLLSSKFNDDDIDFESVYGLMRFGHFIWDETAWKHMKQLLPNRDSIVDLRNSIIRAKRNVKTFVVEARHHQSLKATADELYELNKGLVRNSLKNCESIVLPLSSGFDSRMIFTALAEDRDLKAKLSCFTYGNVGAIEVAAASELCKTANVQWSHLELPAKFLKKKYLMDTADIFGSSLHMHAMYQIEMVENLRSRDLIYSDSTFTTGFMSGAPAGHHIRILGINEHGSSLSQAMSNFSQSKGWSRNALEKINVFRGQGFEESCETKFQKAFNDFDGETYQKTILFDIWTRQRSFVSFHPRVLEWFNPIASPHMNPEYINFFLSLSLDHLLDRRAVQAMFKFKYSQYSKIPSDSVLSGGVGPKFKILLYLMPQILSKMGLETESFFGYESGDAKFDLRAISDAKKDSFFPLLEENEKNELSKFINIFGGNDFFQNTYLEAKNGNINSYLKIVGLQSIALALYDRPEV